MNEKCKQSVQIIMNVSRQRGGATAESQSELGFTSILFDPDL